MKYIFYILPLFVGTAIATQAAVNSQLRVSVNNPFIAAFISFLVGTLFIAFVVLVSRQSPPTLEVLGSLKWYQYTGGLLGAFMVFTVILTVPKIGSANMFSLIVASQLVTALVYDHFGLIGLKPSPINGYRLLGAIMLIVGAYLVNKK